MTGSIFDQRLATIGLIGGFAPFVVTTVVIATGSIFGGTEKVPGQPKTAAGSCTLVRRAGDAIALRRNSRCVESVATVSRSPPARRPVQGQPLAFDDLTGRHLGSHCIAKPEIIVTLAPCGMCRGEVEPFVGQHDVLRHAKRF